MTFAQKVKHSDIISSEVISTKSIGVKTNREKLWNYLWALYFLVQTIVSKFILHADELFTFTIVLLVLKLVTMIILVCLKKTIFQKNHHTTYKVVKFINSQAKLGLLIVTFISHIMFFRSLTYNGLSFEDAAVQYGGLTVFFKLLTANIGHAFAFVGNLFLLVPYTIKVVILYFKILFFPVNLIVYLKWLFLNKITFYEYIPNGKDSVICNKRQINIPGYYKGVVIKKLFFSIAVVLVVIISIVVLVNLK